MKSVLCAVVLTAGVIGTTSTVTVADPWKDESGKYRERTREWDRDRAEDRREWEKDRREAIREWEKDRREAARERDKRERKRWRDEPRFYTRPHHGDYYEYGPLPPPGRYHFEYDRPRYETRYYWHGLDGDDYDDHFDDRASWRHRYWYDDDNGRYYHFRYRRPYYDGRYDPYGYDHYGGDYYDRGRDVGARIGSRLGGALGGPAGAAIGADIGAELGEELDD